MFNFFEYSIRPLFCIIVILLLSIASSIWIQTKCTQSTAKHRNPTVHTLSNATRNPNRRQKNVVPGWLTDAARFQTERRAIFSKTWLCVSHQACFTKPGDYVSQDVAGFRYFLILGRDNIIRGFHNVCRHRAFPITVKASGSSTVLGCKYHGWSYNTRGELVKAPHFDGLEGFDKSANSLYEIKTVVDKCGFVYINLSGTDDEENTVTSSAKFGRTARIHRDSRLLYSCEFKGKFNWKIASIVHEDSWTRIEDLEEIAATPTIGFSLDYLIRIFAPTVRLDFFPLTTAYMKRGSELWYQISYSPDSQEQTTLRCNVYCANTRKPWLFQLDANLKATLERQLKSRIQTYEAAQISFAKTNYAPGERTDEQLKIDDMVEAHLKQEKVQGSEIAPAAIRQCHDATFSQAEGIYRALTCSSKTLDW